MINSVLRKFSTWYFTKQALPYWGVLIMDALGVILVGLVFYLFRHGAVKSLDNSIELMVLWGIFLIPLLIGFRLFHTYDCIIRFSSFVDIQRVGFANTISLVLCLLLKKFLPWTSLTGLYRISDLVIIFIMATAFMCAVRIAVKFLFDMSYESEHAKKVFILGARDGGASLAKSIRSTPNTKYRLSGFISTNEKMKGHWMMGCRIYYKDRHLVETMKNMGVDTMMVSPLCAEELREDSEFVDELLNANIHIRMLPGSKEWDGKQSLQHTDFKEVNVEDLLPRAQINIDMVRIGNQLTGKKIMITGAAGSIGSEMVQQVASFGPGELILVDQAETPMHDIRLMMAKRFPNVKAETIVTSITNASHMEYLFSASRPDYVFHAAAYKHVPMMEDNPAQAIQNNVYGTRVIADLAVKYGTKKFVMISTDKAVNPTNVMGCSKRICEIYVQSLDKAIKEGKIEGVTQFVTTRFGNVLGSNGSVIPLFREQIKQGGPLTVTHPEITRFFMLIPEACKLVLEAGTMGSGGEIYVFDMGNPVKIVDLARRMIKLSNAEGIEIKFTGLRDGEKLYEEVLSDAEKTKPTHHPKIKIAEVREYEYEEALANEKRLYEASFGYDDMETVRIMKEIVPEYVSKHSKYQTLDK